MNVLSDLCLSMLAVTSIYDVTSSVYLQQTQGISLSIHLNELLHYSMAHYMACVSWREL